MKIFYTRGAYAFIVAVILLFITSVPVFAKGPPASASSELTAQRRLDIGETFDGEEFTYQIDFWIFRNVAIGKLTLNKEEDGTYKATLSAHTTGFISRVFTARKDTYIAILEKSADGSRFISRRFTKKSKIGKKLSRTLTELDTRAGKLTITKWKGDNLRSTEVVDVEKGLIYDDPLAAFYNLRYGAYGLLKEGAKFKITTFPKKKKPVYIDIKVEGKDALHNYSGSSMDNAKFLITASLDKDLFASSTGDIEILFDDDLVVTGAVAKDIMLFGDVHGRLKKKVLGKLRADPAMSLQE